ncbi:MAG: DNA/RNA non-specific endonuclease [Acinetobacter sp.]|nr:DNA/RNA non-specific endonuclease [Acinetobacter sp.]
MKLKQIALLGFTSVLLTACNGTASNTSFSLFESTPCLDQFYQDIPPYLYQPKLKKDSYALCYNGLTILYSGVSKTPLWVAEKLTPERLANRPKRQNQFIEEQRLKSEHQSLLKHYRGSGFDRGHMAPNGDMGTVESQTDSFTLTNIVPQHPKHNQNVWRELEEATRAVMSKNKAQVKEAYIITGTLFETASLQRIGGNGGVIVPTALFKAVYYPDLGVIGAYYSPNDERQNVEIISVCELERKAGITLFPQLSNEQKRQVYDLPRSANQVKRQQGIAMLRKEDRSCGTKIPAERLTWMKQQFKWGHVEPIDYSTLPSNERSSATSETQQTSPSNSDINHWLSRVFSWFIQNNF